MCDASPMGEADGWHWHGFRTRNYSLHNLLTYEIHNVTPNNALDIDFLTLQKTDDL